MALVTYLIAPCAGGAGLNVEFDSSDLPVVGGNYYLTFTGATSQGCYEVVDTAEPATGVDTVNLPLGTNYGDCITCLEANPTPTPTPTNTATPNVTPTKTATPTPTKTSTPTPSVTTTNTGTPSVTSTQTPTVTPTNTSSTTPTPSVTTTNTQTPSVTTTSTVTPSNTPTKTPTPTNTSTPNVTPTQTGTAALTPTPTTSVTPTVTPTTTPTPTPFGVLYVDQQYEYSNEMLGSFSGGTWEANLGNAPHPINVNQEKRVAVIDLSAISLGGFGGLNN